MKTQGFVENNDKNFKNLNENTRFRNIRIQKTAMSQVLGAPELFFIGKHKCFYV